MINKDTVSRVEPKDAASVLIYRKGDSTVELLMGRRPVKSSFMPSVYVFPGGAVDRADSTVKSASELNPDFPSLMAVAGKHARAHSIACAAVRETFEETGIMIARHGHIGTIKDPTWAHFDTLREAPDLQVLRYLGRAITPADSPKRFHARFFACDYTKLTSESEQKIQGNGELEDLQWATFDLTDADMHTELSLRNVTRYMLTQLRAMLLSGNDQWVGQSVYSQRKGKLLIQNKAS